MVLVTVVVVQIYWLRGDGRVYRIGPDQFTFLATDDQGQGGASSAALAERNDGMVLECQLVKTDAYPWPYCGISIQLGASLSQGINLEKFHTLRLNLDFVRLDSQKVPDLRVYLRNFNPAYSSIDNEYTLKYNGLEYTPGVSQGAVDIPLANLQVLTWWLADNDIAIEHSAPEFSNVSKLELATGSGENVGHYQLTVHNIELVGNYIEGESLLLGLLIFWVSLALVYSSIEIRRSHQVISLAQSRQLHLRRLNRELQEQNIHFAELANRDALTGAMNRHSIREWLDEHYQDSSSGQSLAVLYLDIDHFKRVNDAYGHKMGDDILREFTMVVLSALDSSQRLVRWGGEEFVVFCPEFDLQRATQLAEKIRHRIEAHIWVHGDPLTTSIGVAAKGNERVNEMLTRADEALYLAKRRGRNQVAISALPQ
ncbi:GGDEF domain-containing protein [Vibrio sp. JPW-9-11-11]|nr:GGDEF domain-containing protein [Vibrio sp. JPW-9-11-11]